MWDKSFGIIKMINSLLNSVLSVFYYNHTLSNKLLLHTIYMLYSVSEDNLPLFHFINVNILNMSDKTFI